MWFGIITLFPEMFEIIKSGVIGKALQKELLVMQCFNPRDFASDKHKTVDDKPYGGGPGMLMMAKPLQAAIETAKSASPTPSSIIYLTPQGKLFDQPAAKALAHRSSLIFLAGRYEGIDERIIEHYVDEEWSIGDYVLTGGELPAMVMIDAITRHLPGVLGDADSVHLDSLSQGLLKYPQFTRPECFEEDKVPSVLLSGNHEDIRRFRLKESLGRTWKRRPDLLANKSLTAEETKLLAEFISEQSK